MEKNHFLQHAENCANISGFARCCPKNTVNTVVVATRSKNHLKYGVFLGLSRRKKHWYLGCFLLRESTTYLTIFGHYEAEKKAAGVTATTTTTRRVPWFLACEAPKTSKFAVCFVPKAF